MVDGESITRYPDREVGEHNPVLRQGGGAPPVTQKGRGGNHPVLREGEEGTTRYSDREKRGPPGTQTGGRISGISWR